RCVCRRGCSCGRLVACRCGVTARLVLTASTSSAATGVACAGRGLLTLELALGPVALVHPGLHADAAEGGAGLEEPVVHVGAQGVQGNLSLAVELGTAHLGATEAAGALHAHTLGARTHGRLHALAHGAAEGHARGKLLGDALCHQLSIDLGVL